MPRLWIDASFSNDVVIGTQFLTNLFGAAPPAQSRFTQFTLLRTIIGLNLGRTVHDSGEGSEQVVMGIGVCSQEAFAGGTVADPGTEVDFPTRGWVWRAGYRVFGFAADQPAIFTQRVDLDIRAMRKIENGVPFMVADLIAVEGVNSTLRITGFVRQLYLVG